MASNPSGISPMRSITVHRALTAYRQLCPDWDSDVTVSQFAKHLGWTVDHACLIVEWLYDRRLMSLEIGMGERIDGCTIIEGTNPPRS